MVRGRMVVKPQQMDQAMLQKKFEIGAVRFPLLPSFLADDRRAEKNFPPVFVRRRLGQGKRQDIRRSIFPSVALVELTALDRADDHNRHRSAMTR